MRKTELFFDSIADDFLERMNPFDQQARVDWFDRALSSHPVAHSTMVDVGAGLGHFSIVGERHAAMVVPIDIAPGSCAGYAVISQRRWWRRRPTCP